MGRLSAITTMTRTALSPVCFTAYEYTYTSQTKTMHIITIRTAIAIRYRRLSLFANNGDDIMLKCVLVVLCWRSNPCQSNLLFLSLFVMHAYHPVDNDEANAFISSKERPFESPTPGLQTTVLLVIIILLSFVVYIQIFTQDTVRRGTTVCADRTRDPPRIASRNEMGYALQADAALDGAELGVQRGIYSEILLTHWKRMRSWHLVDLWGQQENYFDIANVNDIEQQKIYEEARDRLRSFSQGNISFHRMYTSSASHLIANNSLDFVYIDARHDYCGVMEDILLYWPKLRPNGIFAGHDYLDASTVKSRNGQDWGVCQDSTRNDGAVKGAVDDFVSTNHLSLHITTDEWPTWITRKPQIICE